MRVFKKKFATLSLLGLLGVGIIGCGQKQNDNLNLTVTPFTYENVAEDDLNIESKNENNENNENSEVQIINVDIVVAHTRAEIYRNIEEKELIGYLPVGKSLDLLSQAENGYYKVDYYGDTAYISEEKVSLSTAYDIKSTMKKFLYAKTDTTLVIPDYLSETNKQEKVQIPMLECFEVYDENEIMYLVKTEDYIGYIAKENVEELNGTIVVVDISEQKLTLYKDNEIILECPVVTGKLSEGTKTTEGVWEIYDITYNRPLVGPGYSSPVDIMMKFYGNEGFHDATYHSCDFWKKKGKARHGWRAIWEMGGDTYIYDGSHGCVNMIHDDVFSLAEHVSLGTPVIIKK